jgi:hypothetical protein
MIWSSFNNIERSRAYMVIEQKSYRTRNVSSPAFRRPHTEFANITVALASCRRLATTSQTCHISP